jgi:hypothetical protein
MVILRILIGFAIEGYDFVLTADIDSYSRLRSDLRGIVDLSYQDGIPSLRTLLLNGTGFNGTLEFPVLEDPDRSDLGEG